MASVKVKILIPFNEGQKVGDIRKMEKKGALKYEKEGVLEIVKNKVIKSKANNYKNPINENIDVMKQIITRHKKLEGDSYIEVFGADDKKKDKKIRSNFYDINKESIDKIKNELDSINSGTFGSFFNINPLKNKKRTKDNVKRILYAFIDLDDANEDHNELIKSNLEKFNISYSYNAKSGHGYHFLLPLDLPIEEELKVKGFFNYLKNNICDKVDVATYTNERLLRTPESWHFKDEDEKQLKTLHSHQPSKKEIESNSKRINNYQLEQKKGKKDIEYINSIEKEDTFFSSILNNQQDWKQYYNLLNKSENRNDIFIKNLGFFLQKNASYILSAKSFLTHWEAARVSHLEGWINRNEARGSKINYHELLKWSRKHDLKEFTLLLEEQLKTTFLDEYEIYYLENEKKENAYLLYYSDKNYYVQKSLYEVLTTIYYDCKEKGISLSDELGLSDKPDWDEFSHKKKMGIIFSCIESLLDKENRIKMVFNINYAPIDDKFVYYENKKFFNTYTSTSYWSEFIEEKIYHFPHIKELIENLTGGCQKSYIYFNKWLAHIIKYPTEKLPTAIIFQGRQGSGKGTFKNLILDNIFGSNCQEINQTHLESSFNEYLLGKQIIVANEVMHNENRQTLPNVLKNLVTDSEITITRKFRKEIKGNNYTHWIFCTNSDNPIKIEEDDRRYSVFYSNKLKGGGKAAAKFVNDLRKNIDYELKQYISYLKSLDVAFDEVHEPVMTKAKEDIIELNRDSVQRFLEYMKRYDTIEGLYLSIFKNDRIKFADNKDTYRYLYTDDFYQMYLNWSKETGEFGSFNKQNFGKKMSTYGLSNQVKKINKKVLRVYDVDLIENVLMKSQEAVEE